MTPMTPMTPARLLADTNREPMVPGIAVLRMETTPKRTGTFDGAWWPRSRDLDSQLSGLLAALTDRLGPLARVGLDAGAWDERPGHLSVDGRTVRIDWSAVGDDTMIVTRGDQDHFMFLVIPPQTAPPLARAAMAMAVRDDNDASAERILTATGVSPADRTRVLPGAPGW
ncbi:DUF5994 family protein [Streptomyces rishiriensis]|uniref:Uncharacterized protein n=1 Tax=Streptomyces rishiriensis TaxID=68264 RepID=A0ABU0NTJ7_STRRH|nr:DUF5994 family protein [Streptomyces rishiriensis]MDQ0582043.1 hypothetical protein [Streptomyces rishiriensis]